MVVEAVLDKLKGDWRTSRSLVLRVRALTSITNKGFEPVWHPRHVRARDKLEW